MSNLVQALLVTEFPGSSPAREALERAEPPFAVQSVGQTGIAVARLAGGGVDLVVLELAAQQKSEIEVLDQLLKLRSAAAQSPLILVGECAQDGVVQRAIRAGSAEQLSPERCAVELAPLAQACLQRAQPRPGQRLQPPVEFWKGGTTFAVVGAKGGVGTTTIALNVAAALAQERRVVLAELRPGPGSLTYYFHPSSGARGLANLLDMDPIAISPLETQACLWKSNVPGLAVLFAPSGSAVPGDLAVDSARAIRRSLSTLADFIVLDLPPGHSEVNRVLIQESERLLLVVERAPLCIECGQRFLESIESWNAAPTLLGAVVVNRAALAAPLDLAGIERQLAIPLLGVIPPAPELCLSAEAASIPLVSFDPDSLPAMAFTTLAARLLSPTLHRSASES